MAAWGTRKGKPEQVYLNVYDLNGYNETLYGLGLGAYHSGIEVFGSEWTFASGSGIFSHTPGGASGAVFRERIYLGDTKLDKRAFESTIDRLKADWKGERYNVLKCNCNHFADELANALMGYGIPLWVNRMSGLGSMCSCLLPASMLGEAPVTNGSGGDSSSSAGESSRSGSRGARVSAAPAFGGTGNRLSTGAAVHDADSSESHGLLSGATSAVDAEERRRRAAAAAARRVQA